MATKGNRVVAPLELGERLKVSTHNGGTFTGAVAQVHPATVDIRPDSAAVREFLGGPDATYVLGSAHWATHLTPLPVVGNGAIDEAPEDTIGGWRRAATWQYDAESSGAVGDSAVGWYFEGRYVRVADVHYFSERPYEVVTLAFWVMGVDVHEADRVPVYEVCLQRCVTLCTDAEDPGSSEISSEYSHEQDIISTSFPDLASAEAVARALALTDARQSFLTAPLWKESTL